MAIQIDYNFQHLTIMNSRYSIEIFIIFYANVGSWNRLRKRSRFQWFQWKWAGAGITFIGHPKRAKIWLQFRFQGRNHSSSSLSFGYRAALSFIWQSRPPSPLLARSFHLSPASLEMSHNLDFPEATDRETNLHCKVAAARFLSAYLLTTIAMD